MADCGEYASHRQGRLKARLALHEKKSPTNTIRALRLYLATGALIKKRPVCPDWSCRTPPGLTISGSVSETGPSDGWAGNFSQELSFRDEGKLCRACLKRTTADNTNDGGTRRG